MVVRFYFLTKFNMWYQLLTRDGIDSFLAISAVQKRLRRGNVNEALKRSWLLLPDEWYAGYEKWLFGRLLIICIEDCQDSDLIVKVTALKDAYFWIKKTSTGPYREGRLFLTRILELISKAIKSRSTTYRTISQLEKPDLIDLNYEKKVNPFIYDIHTREGKKIRLEKGLDICDRCDQEDTALVPVQAMTDEDKELRAKAMIKLWKKDDSRLFDIEE